MVQPQLSPSERYDLITRGLQEVLGGDAIKKIIEEDQRPLRAYWGTAPTGRPHVGYLVPLTKIADFLTAGVEVKVLLADVHAFLDNLKAPIELVRHRVDYYRHILLSVFRSVGVPTDRLVFVVGSSYQLTEAYNMDNYRLCASVTEHDAKKAGAEVVKQVSSPLLSGLLYPGLQALDEQYLDVDFQFGGVDQRKIFTFAEAYLPKLGYKKRSHLMNAMVPGLKGSKMSSSDASSKIDFLDTPKEVRKKINDAQCVEGIVEDNGVLAFARAVLMPIARLRMESAATNATAGEGSASGSPFAAEGASADTLLSIVRPEKFGGSLHYSSYEALEADFAAKALHPADLKKGVADAIIAILEPIRKEFDTSEEFKKAERDAYPPPGAATGEAEGGKKKKEKKVNPRFAHLVPKSKGGTAESEEAAAAAAAAEASGKRPAEGNAAPKPSGEESKTFVDAAAAGVESIKLDGTSPVVASQGNGEEA